MKPVSPTQAWRDLAYIVATSAVLIGLNNFQSCGGVSKHAAAQMPEELTVARGTTRRETCLEAQQSNSSETGSNPKVAHIPHGRDVKPRPDSRSSDRPARLETIPRVHLRPTTPTLRQVESAEIVKL